MSQFYDICTLDNHACQLIKEIQHVIMHLQDETIHFHIDLMNFQQILRLQLNQEIFFQNLYNFTIWNQFHTRPRDSINYLPENVENLGQLDSLWLLRVLSSLILAELSHIRCQMEEYKSLIKPLSHA